MNKNESAFNSRGQLKSKDEANQSALDKVRAALEGGITPEGDALLQAMKNDGIIAEHSDRKSYPAASNDILKNQAANESVQDFKARQMLHGSLLKTQFAGRRVSNATALGWKHAEAWMHMQYFGQSDDYKKNVSVTIWNSRDGVTPFICHIKELGLPLQHGPFRSDINEPDYLPKKGDLIWVDYDEVTALQAAEKNYAAWVEHLNKLAAMTPDERIAKYMYDGYAQLRDLLADKPAYIKGKVDELLVLHGNPQPLLVLVQEDWPEEKRNLKLHNQDAAVVAQMDKTFKHEGQVVFPGSKVNPEPEQDNRKA